MFSRTLVLVTVIGLSGASIRHAHADVTYSVLNPARDFTLFVYDSPTFIIADTTVGVAQLAFANPLNPITNVTFIPSSPGFPGTSELDVTQAGAPEQFRYYPQGTFTKVGVTPGDINSFGFPSSELNVAVPEPGTFGLLSAGVIGLLGLRRRQGRTVSQFRKAAE